MDPQDGSMIRRSTLVALGGGTSDRANMKHQSECGKMVQVNGKVVLGGDRTWACWAYVSCVKGRCVFCVEEPVSVDEIRERPHETMTTTVGRCGKCPPGVPPKFEL